MKESLVILLFCLFATFAKGQTEVKISPFAWLFGAASLGVEQVLADDWGVDVDLLASEDGAFISVAGKFYFNPKFKADGFHVGLFAGGGSDLGAGVGFLGGYKWMSNRGILFELGLGLGRGTEEILPYGKLHIGYRFNRTPKETGRDR